MHSPPKKRCPPRGVSFLGTHLEYPHVLPPHLDLPTLHSQRGHYATARRYWGRYRAYPSRRLLASPARGAMLSGAGVPAPVGGHLPPPPTPLYRFDFCFSPTHSPRSTILRAGYSSPTRNARAAHGMPALSSLRSLNAGFPHPPFPPAPLPGSRGVLLCLSTPHFCFLFLL